MTASIEPQQPAGESPIMSALMRLVQQIEDSKPNVMCAPVDEARLAQALEDKQMAHLFNLHATPYCKPGEVFISRPMRELVIHEPEVS